jgi:GNAT superfamily N-acetyltransferase
MIENPQGIRKAGIHDLLPLIGSASIILGESALQALSPEKVAALVQRCVEFDRALAGIISGPTGIEASIGLVIESFDYSDEQHLSVKWLGVHPEFQRKNHGATLMSFAKWAQEMVGVPLFMGLSTLEALQAKLHLFVRSAPQVGALFSFGGAPHGAFNQRAPGHDPFMEHKKSRARPQAA